ncbi:hypothetical protein JAAARDRAFT_30317 [Jaapia argillacea MUCL 33604]|uniref:Amidohydrolase-related domain-containing protein n=1 Tax=Jaapia argillacea MUCL 33604 TaxID=933084 RepID=A0A067Q600_9AGAM|nr:hypothetical protein JAAARDRAFT_30317 [Jaapia argillacea MUCL 33604]
MEVQSATAGLIIRRIHLPSKVSAYPHRLYDVFCNSGRVSDIRESSDDAPLPEAPGMQVIDTGGRGILLPSLCHSHIHLDKCFLLEKCDALVTGDFKEALQVTSKAKACFRYYQDDLYARGSRLIRESVQCGVTSMRAHVEVDRTVDSTCLDVGLKLKYDFKDICDVQIAVFAQDPLYVPGSPTPSDNLSLLERAASHPSISAIGSAPYVEPSLHQSKQNINHILDLAEAFNLHVDFHLDYNLNPSSKPLIHYVIEQLRQRRWVHDMPGRSGRRRHVTIGHATRLSLFTQSEWFSLVSLIASENLPISFVALPQSDLYMMGREDDSTNPPGLAPRRGTLRLPRLVREYGKDVNFALSVNNVDNAFTPQGSVDPLSLCPLGVAVYQAGTVADAEILVDAVTLASKRVIGEAVVSRRLIPQVGDTADFLILHGNDTLHSVALNPGWERTTIKGGVVVATRRNNAWILQKN